MDPGCLLPAGGFISGAQALCATRRKAIARGEFGADLDVGMLDYMIANLNVSIAEYCSEISPEAMYETVTESVDALINILKDGIGNRDHHLSEQPAAGLTAER